MNEDRLWFLLARNLSGEASAAETAELRLLLSGDPDRQYLADVISTYFKARTPGLDAEMAGADLSDRLRRIMTAGAGPTAPAEYAPEALAIPKNRTLVIRRRVLAYAAAFLGILTGIGVIWRSSTPAIRPAHPLVRTSEVVSRPGARTKLLLPDGTQVWLNSGSKLHYSSDFNTRLREVTLEGEAFFDVVRDAEHPFIVHTGAINVKVLGTAFNIKSYPRDEIIETTLLRGSIEVTRQDDPSTPKVILKPNEKLIINQAHEPLHLAARPAPRPDRIPAGMSNISITPIPKNVPDSDKAEISWMYNKLVFDGDSFEELAAKMERWYNVRMLFKNERLLKYRFKGVFNNETVKEALDALRLTAAFTYTINDNEILLK